MEDESHVLVNGGAAAADDTQHDGSIGGLLAWFENSKMPGLGAGNPSTAGIRHARNARTTLANVQTAMDSLHINQRVDQPVEQR